jgi:hypothetical protein
VCTTKFFLPLVWINNNMIDQTSDYEAAKKRFEGRKRIEKTQPYIEHTELYLALIEPAYCAEVQKALTQKALYGIESLFTVENSQVNFIWQTTDDQGDTVDGNKVSNPLAIRTFYGPIEQHMQPLMALNVRGVNPCIAVNKIEGTKRTKDAVVAARAIWVEDDEVQNAGPRSPGDFALPYSFVVESSDKKYHYYWLTYTEDLRTWERVQKQVMVGIYGSDEGANGLNRAMRVPGFWHKKTRAFPTRIVFMLDQQNLSITPSPSKDFMTVGIENGGKEEYAFTVDLCSQVKRYDWEEIMDNFGGLLTEETTISGDVIDGIRLNYFDPISAMQNVFSANDYHGSLHALAMHFANYQPDEEYVTNLVQSIMCRVPEAERDARWHARFNDVARSAKGAVTHKLSELTKETLAPLPSNTELVQDMSIHSSAWILPFPDISGACTPLDLMMEEFDRVISKPIRSFNFATIMSFFSVCLQNIPVMPAMGERKANGCHLLLAKSTGGKDINMSGPIRALARVLQQGGYISSTDLRSQSILSSLAQTNSEISSLSAFHKWATDEVREYGSVWVNTECTSIINKMSDENSSVSNLAEVVINIQDGIPIPAVHKAAKKDDIGLNKPLTEAYSLLFATQPASIKKHMNSKLLYKGVIGRFDYYIPSEPPEEEYESSLSSTSLRPYRFSHEILKFLGFMLTTCAHHITSTAKDVHDGHSRDVVIKYDEDDPNVRAPTYQIEEHIDGPNRLRHVNWDLEVGKKYKTEDSDFNIFLNRVPMATERYLTILTMVEHIYQCYLKQIDPFDEPPVTTPALIDCVCKLGNYQYEVRANRIWSLISRNKGLDDKHQAMLDAIKDADSSPSRWMKYLTNATADAYKHLYDKERFISIGSVTRCLTRDANISTRDGIQICKALADYGYVEFVAQKKIDVTVSDRPLKNVVRLTAQGRT